MQANTTDFNGKAAQQLQSNGALPSNPTREQPHPQSHSPASSQQGTGLVPPSTARCAQGAWGWHASTQRQEDLLGLPAENLKLSCTQTPTGYRVTSEDYTWQ